MLCTALVVQAHVKASICDGGVVKHKAVLCRNCLWYLAQTEGMQRAHIMMAMIVVLQANKGEAHTCAT